MKNLGQLLAALADSGASDLHIAAGSVPLLRMAGKLVPAAPEIPVLSPNDVQALVYSMLTQGQQGSLQNQSELDMSFGVEGLGRFRCNIHRQRSTWAAVFRKIPREIPTLKQLGLPAIVRQLALKENGIVLVTGPTGSGKSMTLAAMIEAINEERACHVITIEDPLEFLFTNKKALIKQREIGADTPSFNSALHHIFRQDPDVVVIGEIRDAETISCAISAASAGRLVVGTLHTIDAGSTVDRLVESFPSDQQNLMRTQIAGCLQGIVSQQLVRKADNSGRVLATEVLISTPSIRNLLRAGKTVQMTNDIEVGKRYGMQSMNQCLHDYILAGTIKLEEALRHTRSPETLLQMTGIPH